MRILNTVFLVVKKKSRRIVQTPACGTKGGLTRGRGSCGRDGDDAGAVIDTTQPPATDQAPDSTTVDMPDSVWANFSSFKISFINPTLSAPTSATTDRAVASMRVKVIYSSYRVQLGFMK